MAGLLYTSPPAQKGHWKYFKLIRLRKVSGLGHFSEDDGSVETFVVWKIVPNLLKRDWRPGKSNVALSQLIKNLPAEHNEDIIKKYN